MWGTPLWRKASLSVFLTRVWCLYLAFVLINTCDQGIGGLFFAPLLTLFMLQITKIFLYIMRRKTLLDFTSKSFLRGYIFFKINSHFNAKYEINYKHQNNLSSNKLTFILLPVIMRKAILDFTITDIFGSKFTHYHNRRRTLLSQIWNNSIFFRF